MANLSLKHIYKVYPGDVTAVKDFNLEIADKEFIVFVGPSGCGKSTTLRMIAGLEEISKGELYIGDRLVNEVEPKERDIAMVFQSYALYPHMTVYDNMAFGLKLRKVPKDEIDKKVKDAAKILDIEHLLDRKPKALSGGQRQRVALGRAIVREPKVFLMDEPLSNLDAKLRVQMRTEISKLHQRLQTTFIYVTHDQVEAMTMGTRIVVMKDGIVQQVDSPQEIYNNPANIFVAGFIGSPQMNFIDGTIKEEGGKYFACFQSEKIEMPMDKARLLKEKGYKLAVCSNASNWELDVILKKLEVKDYFDVIQGVTSKNNKKYSLEELLLREKPELAVMVGDRSYDNEAARYNQIPFVGCKYGYGKPEELRECQYTIETVLELPKIIDKIVSIRGGTA